MDMKKREIKKKFKRFFAGCLMVCLMMPSFAGATWADVESYDYTGITKECFIDMDLDALQEQIEYAISYDVRFNSSVMKFDSGDEELVQQYEKLFSDKNKEEHLYYVDYKFGEGVLPAGSKVSVFVRKQRPDTVGETQPAETENAEVQVATPAEAAATERQGTTPVDTAAESIPETIKEENTTTRTTENTTERTTESTTETSTETAGADASETTRGVVQIEMPGETNAETETAQVESGRIGVVKIETPQITPAESGGTGVVEIETPQATQVESGETGAVEIEMPQTTQAESGGTEPVQTEPTETIPTEQPQLETTQSAAADTEMSTITGGAEFTITVSKSTESKTTESETTLTAAATSAPNASETAVSPAKPNVTETAAVAKENQYETATGSNAGKQKTEDYKITGKEEIILFFQNKSLDDYMFQVRIGNRQTGKIYVPSASVLLEEASLEKKRQEALESTPELESTEGIVIPGGGAGGGGGGNSSVGGSGNAGISPETPDKTVTDSADTSQEVTDSSEKPGRETQGTGQEGQESEAGTHDQDKENQEPSGDESLPEENHPASDDKTQSQETNVPSADDNHQAPDANAPDANASDANAPEVNAPEVNAPAKDDHHPVPEANAPVADNNNPAPADGLEVSVSSHQVPRVAAPVAGEVNDEEFEDRPDAGIDEEVSYTADYVVSTDPNEELGTVLEALLYKEKNSVIQYSLNSSRRSTSSASITFLMSEISQPFSLGTGGSLTIRKELNSNEAAVPEGTKYIYDVKITDIHPSAVVTLDGEELPVTGGTLETSFAMGIGESKTFEGLTSGSSYTVTQLGVTEETRLAADEITIEGGEGIIDYETKTVSGTIQMTNALGEGEIIWDKNNNTWHDEAGNLIDVEEMIGQDFQWYKDWRGTPITNDYKISTADLLQLVKERAQKVVFNLNGGGIDVFYGSDEKTMRQGPIWYSVMKSMYGRYNTESDKDCKSKEEIEVYLGDHIIEWKYDPQTGDHTTLVYYKESWRVRPADPLPVTDYVKAQSVTITYSGGAPAAKTNLTLRKQLVTSPDDPAPQADDENQTFLYKIENKDTASTRAGEVFYASITVEKGQTEGSCTITDIPPSTQYEITELENLRYLPAGGSSQAVNTLEPASDLTFTGYKAYTGYFSDTNIIVNRVMPVENGKFQFATEYPDGQPVHANFKLTPPPALLPEKNKSILSDGGEAEVPAA